jgi:hypothetical protein
MYPPQPANPAKDRTTLFGVLGIVGAFCCWPLGFLFAFLSLTESKKVAKPPTLAYVGIGLSILAVLSTGIYFVVRR